MFPRIIILLVSFALMVPATLAAPNVIGNQLQVIGLASQNSAVNNGNTGGTPNHSLGSSNNAQQIATDNQSIEVISNVQVLKNPLVLV